MEDPEMGYWKQKGLNEKQIETWKKITGTSQEILLQSLRHCRYEMVDLGLEESKPVENPLGYFYKVIERAGHYPAPKGYKPWHQVQEERERQIIKERAGHLAELRDLQEQKKAQELEIRFLEMMADPEGDLYKQCFARLNDFEKKKGGSTIERAMRHALENLEEMEGD